MNTDTIKEAARRLAQLGATAIDAVLTDLADAIVAAIPDILAANARDLARMDSSDPKYDRLMLTAERLRGMAADCRKVSSLLSPLGRVLIDSTLPNGLHLQRVSVPFGVIGVIYEARPNVTLDVAALCLKAGSACILKGGKDAADSNAAIANVIHDVLSRHSLAADTVTLLPPTREATAWLLHARDLVDVIIPRGSSSLIDFVRANATVPVIETGAGVVHCYVDRAADTAKALDIVENAKCRRVSVCNALDCLLVHRDRADFLPLLAERLNSQPGRPAVNIHYGDYGREWLSYDLSVCVVDSLDDALDHIRRYGSGHSESIVTEDPAAAERFLHEVDAACVYHNAPTSFTDGGQFGMGAEIGISTQKLHARGPMALDEICTYKWLIRGNGQTRQ